MNPEGDGVVIGRAVAGAALQRQPGPGSGVADAHGVAAAVHGGAGVEGNGRIP